MPYQKPHMKTVELRPFLRKHVPGRQQVDGTPPTTNDAEEVSETEAMLNN